MSYYIYKICCDDCPDYVYVGSTKAFRERKHRHKLDCNNENSSKINRKLYTTIRENGGWDNWRMVIIEECGEITFTEARIKEEEHRVKLNANLNMKKCYITEEEKKERDNLYAKERRNDNLEFFRNKDKEKYQKNKEKILPKKIEYQKEYKKNNPEKVKQTQKNWRENNKEKIMEWKTQRVTCECGRTFRIDGKAEHERSKIHKKLIEENNNNNNI